VALTRETLTAAQQAKTALFACGQVALSAQIAAGDLSQIEERA
jgi:hypothetical protein